MKAAYGDSACMNYIKRRTGVKARDSLLVTNSGGVDAAAKSLQSHFEQTFAHDPARDAECDEYVRLLADAERETHCRAFTVKELRDCVADLPSGKTSGMSGVSVEIIFKLVARWPTS